MIINKSQIMQLMQIAQHLHGDLCMRQFEDDEATESAHKYANYINDLLREIALQQSREAIDLADNVIDLKVVK